MIKKICPNCQKSFICKPEDIANCQCSKIHLTQEDILHLQANYNNCLCLSCLQELGSSTKKSNFAPVYAKPK